MAFFSFASIRRPVVAALTLGLAVGIGSTTALTPAGAASTFDPRTDTGSLWSVAAMVGAQDLWDQGFTGSGVGVAVIDTGITKVPGLDARGKVFDGPDFSFDSQDPKQARLDSVGHGTHLASIIAGRDPVGAIRTDCAANDTACLRRSAYRNPALFEGIAPDAHLVNVKVGDGEGANDVSQIIAAIDWVVAHRDERNLNIRVINLAWGTNSVQPASIDPLVYAVENAWRHGIVVVVASGNDGETTTRVANPATSPMVIAAGASDPNGTLDPSDDTIPTWAEHGTSERPVDVVAPGVHIAGLRVPGSLVDVDYPESVVNDRLTRGSGTSQAAAVVSGVAALLVDKFPMATPDQIKTMLRAGADSFGSRTDRYVSFRGRGRVQAARASQLPVAPPTPVGSDGSGSLEASRGDAHVGDEGAELIGERDIFGAPWDAAAWKAALDADTVWNGGTWRGGAWTGAAWLTWGRWGGTNWTRPTWAAGSWAESSGDLAWTGSRWTGSRWTGSRWTGSRWTGSRWTGSRWTGSRWTGSRWTGSRWTGSRWTGAGWD